MSILQKLIQIELEAKDFGFDWPQFQMIIDQAIDECREIQEVIDLKESQKRLQEEIGDLLHSAISMCLYADLDVEETLSVTYKKFKGRIDSLKHLADEKGYKTLKDQPISLLLELWQEVKASKKLYTSDVNVTIREMTINDIELVVEDFANAKWPKPIHIFKNYLRDQEEDQRLINLAFCNGQFAGYATLKWNSEYEYFAQNNIPEIKDLNVLPGFRQRGIASKLIEEFESAARSKECSNIGIGVGLYAGYGEAQKLYIKKNYKPVGNGITYNYKQVEYGENIVLDDNLVLWFVKGLKLPNIT